MSFSPPTHPKDDFDMVLDDESQDSSPKQKQELGPESLKINPIPIKPDDLVEESQELGKLQQDNVAQSSSINNEVQNKNKESEAQTPQTPQIIQRRVNRNGWHWPLHPFQIISYVVILLDTYAFYFIVIVSFSYNEVISSLLGLAYSLIFSAVVYLAFIATSSDPTDPTLAIYRASQETGSPFNTANYQFFCEVCESYVQSNAKHCGACNRCVDGFDHHCRWLNNCVGRSNYRHFFRLICTVFIMTILHNAADVTVLAYINTGNGDLLAVQSDRFYSRSMETQYNVLLALTLFFNSAAILFLGHLISFHLYLQKHNMTTFEYIQYKANRQNHKSKIFREIKKQQESPKREEQVKQEDTHENLNKLEKTEDGKKISGLALIQEEVPANAAFKSVTDEESLQKSGGPIIMKSSDDIEGDDVNRNKLNWSDKNKPQKRGFFDCLKRKRRITKDLQQEQPSYPTHEQLQNNNQEKNAPPEEEGMATFIGGSQIFQDQNNSQQRQIESELLTENVGDIGQEALNDNHSINVVRYAAGGDDQSHVTLPQIKQQVISTQGSRTVRRDLKNLLNKGMGKQGLEPIQEKAKEEDAVIAAIAQSMSRQQVELEESYSFSLRNYQGGRKASQAGRVSGMSKQYPDVAKSQNSFTMSHVEDAKREISIAQIESFKNIDVEEEGHSLKFNHVLAGKRARESDLSYDLTPGRNTQQKVKTQKDNYTDPQQQMLAASAAAGEVDIVIPISKFSSHLDYMNHADIPVQAMSHSNSDTIHMPVTEYVDLTDKKSASQSNGGRLNNRFSKGPSSKHVRNRSFKKLEGNMEEIAESIVSDIENEDEMKGTAGIHARGVTALHRESKL